MSKQLPQQPDRHSIFTRRPNTKKSGGINGSKQPPKAPNPNPDYKPPIGNKNDDQQE